MSVKEKTNDGILIADAGSTKTDWVIVEKSDGERIHFQTGGINPSTFSRPVIQTTVKTAASRIKENIGIKEVYFYGAGCGTPTAVEEMRVILQNTWEDACIAVDSDLKGAAISLFGKGDGVACILGTGSGTCLIHNGEIISQIPSLGYILGDEGSGSAIGKRFINGVFKRYLPDETINNFQKEYQLSVADLIQKTYKEGSAASFLGSFLPFISRHIDTMEIRELVEDEFRIFFRHNILPYQLNNKTKIGFVGSIANVFKDILKDVAEEFSFEVSKILRAPIEGLLAYHTGKE